MSARPASSMNLLAAAPPTLQALLDMPDEVLERRLMEFIRQSGVKFQSRRAFNDAGWRNGRDPMFARFWRHQGTALVPSPDPLLWDLRAPLLQDEALSCCCVLLWRRSRKYDAQWIGGIESASIPIVAGMLTVNRAVGAPPLNGFYLRKKRKSDGLRRLLEGVPPPRRARVLLVDDIVNKGISKKQLFAYCRHNNLEPAALLVVIDTQRKGRELFTPICPIDAIFTRRDVLGGPARREHERTDFFAPTRVMIASDKRNPLEVTIRSPEAQSTKRTASCHMSPEDIELVHLARDAVVFAALSAGKRLPTLGEDMRGSSGYLPFLGRYLEERGPVFTRISKREFKNGTWFNRLRGCQAVGLLDPAPGTIAAMTVKSAIASATRARKVKTGSATFHKPVWPEEIGDLSLFVYVVEQLVPTKARTADELISEGHEVHGWGLVAQGRGYRGVVCGDLDDVPDVEHQVAIACRKMQNRSENRPQKPGEVSFIRMKGRWLWDPVRPKPAFF